MSRSIQGIVVDVEKQRSSLKDDDDTYVTASSLERGNSTASAMMGYFQQEQHERQEKQQQQGMECTLDTNYRIPGGDYDDTDGRRNRYNCRFRRCCIAVVSFAILALILIVSLSATLTNSNKNKQADDNNNTPSSIIEGEGQQSSDDGWNNDNAFPLEDEEEDNNWQESNNNNNSNNDNVVVVGNYATDDQPLPPFSVLDPVNALGRYKYDRPEKSSPSPILDPLKRNNGNAALPTNVWYQNILRLNIDEEPTKDHRAYTMPYVLDAAGTFPGLRTHSTHRTATATNVNVHIDEPYALTLGAATSDIINNNGSGTTTALKKGYTVHEATELGVTLHWGDSSYMKSTLVRGSPYVTMTYDTANSVATNDGVLPTMRWTLDTRELPLIDGERSVDCQTEPIFTVRKDIEVVFFNSDQRWLVFFSKPVEIQCHNVPGQPTIFQVLNTNNNNPNDDNDNDNGDSLLVIRGAVVVDPRGMKSNAAPVIDDNTDAANEFNAYVERYVQTLRAHADVYPGEKTDVTHSFDNENNQGRISFNWDPQSMKRSGPVVIPNIPTNDAVVSRIAGNNPNDEDSTNNDEMIMFALPHHREVLSDTQNPVNKNLCTMSLIGEICLTKGNVWHMYEDLPVVDLQAPRHPDPKYVPVLADAIMEDIQYQIPSNFQIGAGDTYFSGKTIARLARILLIAEELIDLCTDPPNEEYKTACDGIRLPSDEEIDAALVQLRDTVTVWVRTNDEAPWVYDTAWGGHISCGCMYVGGHCTNALPDCPGVTDQGLNFGNGFYNDHHFHYGYHVYAAAVVAHFDPNWAIEYYEDVSLLVRDYANPSSDDKAFPTFRNKDWYRGHSYASGITEPMFRNVMNQESTSEAIASYEAVALYGKVMTTIFENSGDLQKASVAKAMHNIGLSLTATEIRSTQNYWHVKQNGSTNQDDERRRFPASYKASVVGILWETMVEFTTFFGNAPYLIYGIQLLPLTPISEQRDDQLEWIREMYAPLKQSCNDACVNEGWSVQINAILATLGDVDGALSNVLDIPSTAYDHAGGNGHSKSNTIWYISTRPPNDSDNSSSNIQLQPSFNSPAASSTVNNSNNEEGNINKLGIVVDNAKIEFDLDDYDYYDYSDYYNTGVGGGDNIFREGGSSGSSIVTCSDPDTCTNQVLNTMANGYSCGDRIQYLIRTIGRTETEACQQVAVVEYPNECGLCQP